MMATSATPQTDRVLRKSHKASKLSSSVKKRKLVSDFLDTENIGSPKKKSCVTSPIKCRPLQEISSSFGITSFYSNPSVVKKHLMSPVVCIKRHDHIDSLAIDESSNDSTGSLGWLDGLNIKVSNRPKPKPQSVKKSIQEVKPGMVVVEKEQPRILSTDSVIESILDSDGDLSSETSSLSDHESSLASIWDFEDEDTSPVKEKKSNDENTSNESGKKFFKNKNSRSVTKNQSSRDVYMAQVMSKKLTTPKSIKKIKQFAKGSAKKTLNNTRPRNNIVSKNITPPHTKNVAQTLVTKENVPQFETISETGTPSLFSDETQSVISTEKDSSISDLATEDSISLISSADSLAVINGSSMASRMNGLETPSIASTPSTSNWPISFKTSSKQSVMTSPRNSPGGRFLKLKQTKDGKSQMILDVGQKSLGTSQCPTCGVIYTRNDPSDEIAHRKFHERMITTLKFSGWKKEHVLENLPDGSRILTVLPNDPKYAIKKLEEIKELVDKELGFLEESPASHSNRKTFLYISDDRKIIGVCITEEISQAYPVLSNTISQESDHQRAWCCSTDGQPAVCGISRIWVFHQARRHNIATRLLDAVRRNFTFGLQLEMTDIAFSDPTPDGKLFATKYTGTPNFLVYKFDHTQ